MDARHNALGFYMKEIERLSLFPTPVFKFNIGRSLTDEEKSFVEACSQDTYQNVGNVVSVERNVLDRDPMKALRADIQAALDIYLASVYAPKFDVSIYPTQSWLNFTNPGYNHHVHSHPNSFVSGTFYFSADGDMDSISFFNPAGREIVLPQSAFNTYNSDMWIVPVETGDIVLFPSNLRHCVENTVQERTLTRISLAFNTYLSGQLGDERHLTYLRL